MLSGCQSSRLDSAFQPSANANTGTDYAYAAEAGVMLPDEVAVLPSSFAGPSPSEGSYEVASLSPAEIVGPARDVFPEAPEARVPDEPAKDVVWAPRDTPRGELDRLIAKYAALYEVPEPLVRRVVKRESNFNPKARNGPYWGLMQILPQTATGMGYKGNASGLLDAETNLKYAVKYLRGAYLVADGNHDRAVGFYARGYYYDAKRMGLLEETGLGKDRRRKRA